MNGEIPPNRLRALLMMLVILAPLSALAGALLVKASLRPSHHDSQRLSPDIADAVFSSPQVVHANDAGFALSAKMAQDNTQPAPVVADSKPDFVSERIGQKQLRELSNRCAPSTPAGVIQSIVKVESGSQPWLIGVNGAHRHAIHPRSRVEAEATAQRLIALGQNIDLGLAQINSRNLKALGVSVSDVFDPCVNLAAAARILDIGYRTALQTGPSGQPLLATAVSLYNTGNTDRGFENGYVAKVDAAIKR